MMLLVGCRWDGLLGVLQREKEQSDEKALEYAVEVVDAGM
jgi:hypothetical protein